MSVASVTEALCSYFGGRYDPLTRTYRQPQLTVPGLTMGAVRRGKAKRLDLAEFTLGIVGATTGCIMWISLTPGEETREGYGGSVAGLKKIRHDVVMDCAIRSESSYAEDVRDAQLGLQEAIAEHIRADRTCGSGGIEAGGFQVGEGPPPGIRWTLYDPVTRAEKTEALVRVTYPADEYVIA